jgi:hypothetical protein
MQVTSFTFFIIFVLPPALISVGKRLKIVCEIKLQIMYEHLFQQKWGECCTCTAHFGFHTLLITLSTSPRMRGSVGSEDLLIIIVKVP